MSKQSKSHLSNIVWVGQGSSGGESQVQSQTFRGNKHPESRFSPDLELQLNPWGDELCFLVFMCFNVGCGLKLERKCTLLPKHNVRAKSKHLLDCIVKIQNGTKVWNSLNWLSYLSYSIIQSTVETKAYNHVIPYLNTIKLFCQCLRLNLERKVGRRWGWNEAERRLSPGIPLGQGWALAWLRSAGVWHGKGIRVEFWIHSHAQSWPVLFYSAQNEKVLPAKPKALHSICLRNYFQIYHPNNFDVWELPLLESGKYDAYSAAWQAEQKMIKWYWQELFL